MADSDAVIDDALGRFDRVLGSVEKKWGLPIVLEYVDKSSRSNSMALPNQRRTGNDSRNDHTIGAPGLFDYLPYRHAAYPAWQGTEP